MGQVKPETIAAAQAQLLSMLNKRPATSPPTAMPPHKRQHVQAGDEGTSTAPALASDTPGAAGDGLPLHASTSAGPSGRMGSATMGVPGEDAGLCAPEPLSIKTWQPPPDDELPKGVIDGPDMLGAAGEDDDFEEVVDPLGQPGAPLAGSARPPRPPALVPPSQGFQWPANMNLASPLGLDAQSLLMALNMSNPALGGMAGDASGGWPAMTSPLAGLGEDGSAASTPSGSSALNSPAQAPLLFFMPQMHLMNPLLMGSLLSSHAAAQQLAAAQANLQLSSAMEDMLKQMPGMQLPANFPKLDNMPALENWSGYAGGQPAKGTALPAGPSTSRAAQQEGREREESQQGLAGPSQQDDGEQQHDSAGGSGRRLSDGEQAAQATQAKAASIMALRGSLLAYINDAEEVAPSCGNPASQPPKPQQQPGPQRQPLVPPQAPPQHAQASFPAGTSGSLMPPQQAAFPAGATGSMPTQAAFPAGAIGSMPTQAAFPAGATGAMPLPHNPLGMFPMGGWLPPPELSSHPRPLMPPGALGVAVQGMLPPGAVPQSALPLGAIPELPLAPPTHPEPAVIKSHGGKPKRTVDLEALRLVYDLPINEAAKKLGLGRTVLKKYCRRLNIPRWPYRKLKSMDKLIEVVEEYSRQDPTTSDCMQAVLKELRHFRQLIFLDPAIDLEARIKRLRQANFKLEHKLRSMWRQLSNETGGGGKDDDGEGSE